MKALTRWAIEHGEECDWVVIKTEFTDVRLDVTEHDAWRIVEAIERLATEILASKVDLDGAPALHPPPLASRVGSSGSEPSEPNDLPPTETHQRPGAGPTGTTRPGEPGQVPSAAISDGGAK